ncbi:MULTISPECIES: fluoride efflux transporter FluC [Staphylococcus]|uniref:Fluoride-specific ion channel FluC n=1 Tax=Staphylococcus hsinchuensis TaxID=3051183 RepID=A0ABZ3ECL5_9STAP|nr:MULTISPECIES: CrcB family protein [unclassified Staphylococcus]
MIKILLLMCGGGIGAVIRGTITHLCQRYFNSQIPIATSLVNILGSFIIGMVMALTIHNTWIHPFFVVGVLGGFTTFSTLSSELVKFLTPNKQYGLFFIYSTIQYVGAFIACICGYYLI